MFYNFYEEFNLNRYIVCLVYILAKLRIGQRSPLCRIFSFASTSLQNVFYILIFDFSIEEQNFRDIFADSKIRILLGQCFSPFDESWFTAFIG